MIASVSTMTSTSAFPSEPVVNTACHWLSEASLLESTQPARPLQSRYTSASVWSAVPSAFSAKKRMVVSSTSSPSSFAPGTLGPNPS